MPDPTDPPRKNKRAKRTGPQTVIDPSKPNATIELETADLMQLGQSGLVKPAVTRTRELAVSEIEELGDGPSVDEPREPNVIVDLEPDAPATIPVKLAAPVHASRVTPSMPRAETPRATAELRAPKQGMGLVIVVYVVSAAALAASIYFRWFA